MVIFFDIDGTIIDDKTHKIPASAVGAVERLVEQGHIPIINTGRPFYQVDKRVMGMAFRGFACGCGMEVRLDGKHSYHPIMSREVERLQKAGHPIHQLAEEGQPDFVKFVTFAGEGGDVAGFKGEMGADYTIIDRENGMYELVLKGFSKAAGMERILSRLGADPEDTLAIGDSTNDLPMFALAKHTVCMGGGMEEVKAMCEYVTDTVMNDGIEKALKHYGLI